MNEGLRDQVRAAVAAPFDGTLGSRFVAPLVTWLVADASAPESLGDVLAGTMAALERVGVLRGRQFVLLGGDPVAPGARARAKALRAELGVPVLVHDPEREGFVAGTLGDGTPVELDDELREAEAIVAVAIGGAWALAGAVVPGVACARTRAAFERARAAGDGWGFVRAAEREAPLDLAVWCDERGGCRVASGAAMLALAADEAGER